MYSSGLSKVSKHGPQGQNKVYRSKGKSCSYYYFFFSSLIQSLIIVSLVLFLVYGTTHDSASEDRILDLEHSFSRLSMENVALKQQRKNLTNLLNATMTAKASNDLDLIKLRQTCNLTVLYLQHFEKLVQKCQSELDACTFKCYSSNLMPPPYVRNCNCGDDSERLKAKFEVVMSNFTQTTQMMRLEMDQTARDRDRLSLEAISLRRDKSTLEKQLEFSKENSREEFSKTLSSVSSVSKAFLQKIESLFPAHIVFQLTCPKQREHLEQIRSNCTSLSREVEDKLQNYLNNVGRLFTDTQAENHRLKAENWRFSEDYRWCSQNRTGLIQQHGRNMEGLQQKHDQEKEKILYEKLRLIGEIDVLSNTVTYKNKEIDHLTEKIRYLNMSCLQKPGLRMGVGQPPQPVMPSHSASPGGGSSSSFPSLGSSLNLGSTGSAFNKPASPGAGSSSSFPSLGSSLNLGSTGSAFNKPASPGAGSSSSFPSLGSSPSLGSTGTALNKPGSGGASSTFGSTGSNPNLNSGGLGLNKPTGYGLSHGSFGLGSNKPTSSAGSTGATGANGSAGSMSKSGPSNSGFNWLGTGSSNPGQSKPGSVPGRGTSSGTGSSFGTGRTSGVANAPTAFSQHIQDVQRQLNAPGPEDKQSERTMG
ncbi:plasmalemma vesicle associated protein a [Mugil cephalus]|uniref:plasmalemma vesicle associated protein a n=1 Tax=Mugil cephalus TaxID=48193 RepID=UPI001FB7A6CF|nr:plasmalemma vesicle associated protein a [Mugil cephalus]